ncbi:MAG TPA: hypothetical protein VGL05_29675 [Kribbella sp.]
MITVRRSLRAASLIGLTALAATALPATAHASVDSHVSVVLYKDCAGPDKQSASAFFQAYGDLFVLRDDCSDGHSSQLQVDAAPFGSTDHYDWRYTDSRGWGSRADITHNYPEGTELAVRACVSEGTKALACGPWMRGEA